MKRYKKEQDGKLEVGQVLYTKHFALTLDRELCRGCELCMRVCPREAITLVPAAVSADGKAVAALVDVDENKCDFHGICAVVCPFSAISITMNGKEGLPAVAAGVFPTLTRDIKANSELCEPGCRKCEESCPLSIVSVHESGGSTAVDIKTELCASCQVCMMECPADAIEVTKFIEGSIRIQPGACPAGCVRCLDVCPVEALAVGGDGKVYVRDVYCIYCGACLQVCPESDALSIERTAIRHTPVSSGAWHKGLEKITSAKGLMREMSAERIDKVRQSVINLGVEQENEQKNP
jgi:4Fe-4S ferredoxin